MGTDIQSLLKCVQMNKWTMERKIGVPLARGLDVSNFLKDVPRVPKSVLEYEMTSNYFPNIPKGMNGPWAIR